MEKEISGVVSLEDLVDSGIVSHMKRVFPIYVLTARKV